MNTLPFARRLLPVLLAAAPLAAQPPTRESAATITAPAIIVAEPITIDFRGGSLAQLAAAIASSGRGTFNIVGAAEDVNAAVLPAFSVRNADPSALMESLNALLQSQKLYLERPRKGNEWIEGTYTVYRRASLSREQRPTFESFQLRPYLANHSIDDIVAAVRGAWELDPAHAADALRLKFHPPTGILLVSGPEDAIRIAHNVVSKLTAKSEPPVSEQRRLEDIQAEMARRRGERENAASRSKASSGPAPAPLKESEKK